MRVSAIQIVLRVIKLFGLEHGLAGLVHRRLHLARRRARRDANRQAEVLPRVELVVELQGRFNAALEVVGQALVTTRHQYDEFVATNARHAIRSPGRGVGQHLAHAAQQGAARPKRS